MKNFSGVSAVLDQFLREHDVEPSAIHVTVSGPAGSLYRIKSAISAEFRSLAVIPQSSDRELDYSEEFSMHQVTYQLDIEY